MKFIPVQNKFIEEGWKPLQLFMRGTKFVKDDNFIIFQRSGVIVNETHIRRSEPNFDINLIKELSNLCSTELTDIASNYAINIKT